MKKSKHFNLYRFVNVFCISLLALSLTAQQWEPLGDVPFSRHHSNGFGIDGKAYIIAGSGIGGTGNSKELWEYIPADDSWVQLDDFPGVERGFAIGDDWNGKYYFGFGTNSSGRLSDLWEFDPADNSFKQLPYCPCESRSHPALVAHNDKVFVGAGSGDGTDLEDWWELDLETQVWTQKPNIPGGQRHHPYFFAIDEFIYVGGGHLDNWIRYNPATEGWIEINDMPLGRVAGTQFSYGGKGFVLAGDKSNHQSLDFPETFMSYDPAFDSWEILPPLPDGSRWAPSSFILEDDLYFFGGTGTNNTKMWKIDLTSFGNPISSTQSKEFSTEIVASPNPVLNTLYLSANFSQDAVFNLSVVNLNGQLVFTKDNFRLEESIDFSRLAKGIYFVELTNEETTMTVKVIKEK